MKAAPLKNLLPMDGLVNYYGRIFKEDQAAFHFQKLMKSIEWQNDIAILFGKKIITKRKVAWYGDQPYRYTYSHSSKFALPFTSHLLDLKDTIEEISGEKFNSCLLNLYHDGNEGMAWHSDGEKDLKKDGAIASLSFGAERKFSFKHKETGHKVDLLLENGSLLMMKEKTQSNWLHRLPPTKKIHSPRVNLTFRSIAV